MSELPLNHRPSQTLIQEWHQRGLITAETHAALLAQLRPAPVWRQWASWNLLGLGTALVLSGIIFFFAYNWQGMSRLERLAVAQVGLFAAAIASRLVGSRTLLGHLLTLSACVMIGVFLAVFGQAYQTGADTYQLFTGWAMLMLVWVVAQCFAPLWIVWLSVLSTGIALYFSTETRVFLGDSTWDAFFSIGLLHLAALAAREALLRRGHEWLAGNWLRIWLLFIALGQFTIPAVIWGFSWEVDQGQGPLIGAWALTCIACFYIYRFLLPSLGALALVLCSACAVMLSAVARIFFEDPDVGLTFLYGLVVTLVLGGVIALLRSMGRHMAREQLPQPPPLPRS